MTKSGIQAELNRFLTGLKSRNEEIRFRAAKELKRYIGSDLKEASAEDYLLFVETLCLDLTSMMNNSDINERKAAVIGMGCIAEMDFMSMHSHYLKFANQVQSTAGITSDLQLTALQAHLIGQFGLIFSNDYIEGQIKRACEVLTDDNKPESHKQFATLTLREIALHTPTSFFQHVNLFIDAINTGIRDKQLVVRETCAMALRAAFTVTAEREVGRRKEKGAFPAWYLECAEEVFRLPEQASETVIVRRLGKDEWWHGSLLLLNEMLSCSNADHEQLRLEAEEMAGMTMDQFASGSAVKLASTLRCPSSPGQEHGAKQRSYVISSAACKSIIAERLQEVWGMVLKNLNYRWPHMTQLLLQLLPRLAGFNPSEFQKFYLKDTMDFIMTCLRKDREKPLCFLAVGLIAYWTKEEFISRGYMTKVVPYIRSNLPPKDLPSKKRSQPLESSLFLCMSLLAKAVGPEIHDMVKEMLDAMLATGLSQPLTETLKVLAAHIPQLKKDIQDGLLKTLSMILMYRSSRQTMGTSSVRASTLSSREIGALPQATSETHDTVSISLALKTLGTFDFEGHTLNQFVRHAADNFIFHEYKEVRLEAVRTCSYLMTPLLKSVQRIHTASRTSLSSVDDILNKLLIVVTSDTDSEVRLCVLESLDERFNPHLAQTGHLDSLFIALHDEKFEIRELAMRCLGRLSAVNPACVQPPLRKVLLQTLTELEHSGSSRNKEQAARLLANMISTAPRFIQPYAEPLMIALLPRLRCAKPAQNVGTKCTDLVAVGGSSCTHPSHLGLTIESEPASVLVAMFMAVGELAQVAGQVMKQHIKELFPILIHMMQDSSSFEKRKIAVWTLGQLVSNTGYVVIPYEQNPELLNLLLQMLKNEEAKSIRREVIRVLGLIGALDPFKLKIYSGVVDSVGDTGVAVSMHETSERKEVDMSQAELLVNLSWAGPDEFFAACSMSALMQVLRDPALRSQYDKIVQSIIFVFKALGTRSVQYLRQVMPAYLDCLQEAHDARLKEFLIHQLGAIMDIVRIHIKEFMPRIVDLVISNWTTSQSMIYCISLVEHMVFALNTEFKPYLARLIPLILRVLNERSNDNAVKQMLTIIPEFKHNLEEYVHIFVPAIARILDSEEASLELKRTALDCLARLTDAVDLANYAGRIVQTVCRLLERQPELGAEGMDTITGLLVKMGDRFMVLVQLVMRTLAKTRIQHTKFTLALSKVGKISYAYTRTTQDDFVHYRSNATLTYDRFAGVDTEPATIRLQRINSINLERAWQSSKIVSREDWNQWLKTFSNALLRESPSPAIRACSNLSTVTPTVAKTLFNAAFVSCWPELTDQQQDDLISTLEIVLAVPDQTEVSQTVLNLAEFMAHCERGKLPLNTTRLAERAIKNRAYAKALYYKEMEFLEEARNRGSPTQETLSALLSINNKLQLEEAADGVLIYATRLFRDKLVDEEAWYEKLHNWTRALNLYERKLEDDRKRETKPLVLGRMRCLRSLGEWQQLHTFASDRWKGVDDATRLKIAPMAANAAWAIGEWDSMVPYVDTIPRDTYDGSFLRAVLGVHKENYHLAQDYIDKARDILDADLTAMAGESYNRAYDDIVCAQMLSELEEVIQYKLVSERRDVLRQAWRDRLLGCQSVVEHWCQVLQIRSLVILPREDIKTWLRFAGLCRRTQRMALSRHVISLLLGLDVDQIPAEECISPAHPEIVFSYSKLLWSSGHREEAVKRLSVLIDTALKPVLQLRHDYLEREGKLLDYKHLLAKCCLKLGSWYSDLHVRHTGPLGDDELAERRGHVIRCYRTATEEAPGLRQAWQSWAMANYAVISHLTHRAAHIAAAEDKIKQEMVTQQALGVPLVPPMPGSAVHGYPPAHVAPAAYPGPQQAVPPVIKDLPQISSQQQFFRLSQRHQMQPLNTQMPLVSFPGSLRGPSSTGATFGQAAGILIPPEPANQSASRTPPALVFNESLPLTSQLLEAEEARNTIQGVMEQHSAPAVRGFVNAVSLSPRANLQDSLRLINLLFKFGHLVEIRDVLREGLSKIQLENWLLVIQQLLARIDTTKEHVAGIIVDLLIAVGKKHPQAMINPLVLSFKSGGSDRRRYNANKILYSMEEHSPRLVSEGFLLNEELIRLAITWMEMWHECLEDASRVYFGDRDIKKMFKLLHPLHMVMERTPETLHETAFHQEYYTDLSNARNWCMRYEETLQNKDLQQAWEIYYSLYRKIAKQVSNMSMLELTCASPRLHQYAKDWVLAIPGSYEPNRPVVTISGIKNTLNFIISKQHPRKLTIEGCDGHNYMFLLKGHEDIRQDERVMQFFGLANTLLMNNPETFRRNLTIQRMSVIPLSTNTGLIGWVPNSDTLHTLIRDHREKTKVLLNLEHRVMLKMAPDFDRLNVMQKTEVFEAGLRESSGRDLANILWLKSHSSEAWFERRTNFIRSLATMSMIGYILGLGDRHPSNIMLCKESGKVIHIDFGDCFEVAMKREKFPEKVPFRLTRMIIEAMEVTGIDGTFRHTCEQVMELMRANRESLLAVLEAFIHDPLLQWVLLENRKDFSDKKPVMRPNQRAGDQAQQPQGLQRQMETQQSGMRAPLVEGSRRNQAGGMTASSRMLHPGATMCAGIHPTDPGYPESASLRDPHNVNPWRHHLCNGPWLGCYEVAKKMRKQTENGNIIVERRGLEGFIFSAKPLSEDKRPGDPEEPTMTNTRAMDVMLDIQKKLDGEETGRSLEVKEQVEMLIREATSNQNLCQMYIGWCAFW